MRLTDSTEITVPEGKSEVILFDGGLPGFGVRVRKGGSRRYIFQYKIGGVQRRVTFKEKDIKSARKAALGLAAKVTLGGDPQLDKQ
jgi:hypothetical protein